MLEPSPLRDERVALALNQLALARQVGEQTPIDRAESLVISLLLPFALERTDVGSDPAAVADVLRVVAARLTAAVMAWDPALPPEHAATRLIRAAVPRPSDPAAVSARPAPAQHLPRPASATALPESAAPSLLTSVRA